MPLAIITGASRGLGLALARALARREWALVIDAPRRGGPARAPSASSALTEVAAIAGDVADERHRRTLIDAAGESIDLLVNNASTLGPSPQPALADYPLAALETVYRVNLLAPLALAQLALPRMPDGAGIINVTSDAAIEAVRGLGRLRLVEGRARAADRRSSVPSTRRCGSTRSTRGTCAPRCTRRPSPARTSPIARRPRTAFPDCWP